jgi:hypothetical protein
VKALLVAVLALACSQTSSASKVADRFVDYYFVEIDQEKALPLTTATARVKLEEELRQVKTVRDSGYVPSQAKASVYYERTYLRQEGTSARAIYDITIKAGSTEDYRHVLVSLSATHGTWRVSSFTIREGKAEKAPP